MYIFAQSQLSSLPNPSVHVGMIQIIQPNLDQTNERATTLLQFEWDIVGCGGEQYILNVHSVKHAGDITSGVYDGTDTGVARWSNRKSSSNHWEIFRRPFYPSMSQILWYRPLWISHQMLRHF